MSMKLCAMGVMLCGILLSCALVKTAEAEELECSTCMMFGGECNPEYGGPHGTRGCGYQDSTTCGKPCDRCLGSIDFHMKLCTNHGDSDEKCEPTGTVDCGNKKTGVCIQYFVGPNRYCKCPKDGTNDDGECGEVSKCS